MKASEKYSSVPPCPLCGSDDLRLTVSDDFGTMIRCWSCFCEAPAQNWLTQERLRWERQQRRQLEEVKRALIAISDQARTELKALEEKNGPMKERGR